MDADKIKNFFLLHGEKFVVALVIVASAWMIYGGLQMPDMRNEKQPDQLMAEANQVRTSIDDDHNEAILPLRVPTFDIVAETLKKQAPVDPTPYSLPNLLERQEIVSSLRRGDPVLVAPLELRTSGHIESIAVLGSRNRVADLEDADELEKIEAPKARAPRSRGRGRGGMGMDGMGMDGMGMDGMGMDGMGMDGMGMDGMGMDGMGMDGMGMDGMGMDGMGMDAGGKRQLSSAYNFGYQPSSTSSSGSSTKEPVPQNAWFIAGSALLPHKLIAESYRATLAEADGYLPIRDQPLYFNYEIQRAEVTNKTVDQLQDKDWIQIANRESDLKRAAFVWAGYAAELVHSDYRDVNLTGYIPPVLISDYSSFAVHPMIPEKSKKELEQLEYMESQDDVEADSAENTELAELGSSPGMGMGGGMDSGMDYGDMNMDMDMGAGMGMSMGMGMSASMAMVEQDPVEHKIMRFYDFARGGDPKSPMPGRKYVYRLRYAVQDPNFPANPIQQPKSSTLQGDVYTRVQELMKQAVETKKRDFQRWSPWSAPSPPASLPGFNDYFAGPVEQPKLRSFDIAGRIVQYAKSPPKAKVLSLNHNVQFSASMPVWLDEITEGSALAAKGELEIIDPISLKVKKVPDAKALSGTTVIDLEGGQSLEIEDKDTLVQPGMMLIFDEFGGLRVSSEIDDQERYRIFSFAEERGL